MSVVSVLFVSIHESTFKIIREDERNVRDSDENVKSLKISKKVVLQSKFLSVLVY